MNIQNIASLAGVSKATVSRVINKLPGARAETVDRINKIIEETGWTPSNGARNLSKKRQGHIAVIAEDVTNPFYREIIAGIHTVCLEKDYQFIMSNSYSSVTRRQKLTKYFLSGGADGLILIESDLLSSSVLKHAQREEGRPTVLIENQVSGIASVKTDNRALGALAANYLFSLGHTRIAQISGNYNFQVARDRSEGFLEVLALHDIKKNPRFLMFGDFNSKSGYDAMTRLLSSNPRPTAVYAANDEMAYAAWKAALDMGFRVPEDISILGTDGIPLFHDFPPRLTTIRQPCFEMGSRAAKLLFAQLEGNENEANAHIILPFELKEGDTCAAPADN